MSWIKEPNRFFKDHLLGWQRAEDHLSGEAGTSKRSEYLQQKEQGEADKAFEVRWKIADYTPHFMRAVISLAGMLFQREDDAERAWSDVIGDPQEEDSDMARLWEDADGNGTNWPTLLKLACVDLIAKRDLWVLVEGVTRDAEGAPINAGHVRLIPPEAVEDVVMEGGRPVEVQVASERDERTSVKSEEDFSSECYVYTLDGYEIWQEGDDGEAQQVREEPYGENGFAYYATADRRRKTLPIFKVQVPVRTNVGALMAQKATSIFNMESARDFHLWAACFARLVHDLPEDGDGKDFEARWKKNEELMKDGSTRLVGPAQYISPPMDGAKVRNATIERKVEEFYQAFFQSYGDAAAERTATEIRQEAESGVAAYLNLLATTMDELEKGVLWRLDQINAPSSPASWGAGSVKRTRDFTPVDAEAAVDGLTKRWVGEDPLPLTQAVAERVAEQVAARDGVALEEGEAEEIGKMLAEAAQARVDEAKAKAEGRRESAAADRLFREQQGGVGARLEQQRRAAGSREDDPSSENEDEA